MTMLRLAQWTNQKVHSQDIRTFVAAHRLPVEDGQNHLLELSKLAEKDPEFFKYLQENDKELLEFDPNGVGSDGDAVSEVDDIEMSDEQAPTLTTDILRKWQKAILEVCTLHIISYTSFSFSL